LAKTSVSKLSNRDYFFRTFQVRFLFPEEKSMNLLEQLIKLQEIDTAIMEIEGAPR
jgi:hypothetical protein